MTRLAWSERKYETGIDHGVLYPKNSPAEIWPGLISVNESIESETKVRYLDGVKIGGYQKPGEFAGTIEAFTYPDILDTSQTFDLSYRTMTEKSYQLHLIYNVLLQPTEHTYQQNDADPFSWDFTTTPVLVPENARSAHLTVEAGLAYSWTLEALEDVLYGSDSQNPNLPSPTGIYDIFEENSILRIIDHGDGTWTAIGPDEAIVMLDSTTFEITWPSAVYISSDTYTIHSL